MFWLSDRVRHPCHLHSSEWLTIHDAATGQFMHLCDMNTSCRTRWRQDVSTSTTTRNMMKSQALPSWRARWPCWGWSMPTSSMRLTETPRWHASYDLTAVRASCLTRGCLTAALVKSWARRAGDHCVDSWHDRHLLQRDRVHEERHA